MSVIDVVTVFVVAHFVLRTEFSYCVSSLGVLDIDLHRYAYNIRLP